MNDFLKKEKKLGGEQVDIAGFAQAAKDILESMDGFIAADKDGRITYMNENGQRALDRLREECMSQSVKELFPEMQMHLVLEDGKARRCTYINPFGAEITQINFPIYHNGDKVSGKIIGVMGFFAAGYNPVMEPAAYRKLLSQSMNQSEDALDRILGQSQKIKEMKILLRRIANTSAAVCVLGETGTGKELVADAIHKLSGRVDRPFVKINCAAIPKDLMESELFGYEPGAFTSASRHGKIGKFELADGGTLLLDEIGELPLNLQAKLLRVLQANELERVGGVKPIPINIRLVCSTNRDLQQMVKAGIFRDDLYYRINVMEVTIPALRERLDDLPILVEHFIHAANQRHQLSVTGINKKAENMLSHYHWPGNIRELEHSIERACVLCGTGYLEVKHFSSLPIDTSITPNIPEGKPGKSSLRSQRYTAEQDIIINAMEACGGNKTKAAEMLNITRATLYSKLRKYGLFDESV